MDSPWYHDAPVSAIGPTANGATIELYSAPPVVAAGLPQSRTLASGCHTCTGVPPQLDEIRPIGTVPPSASWMSRPISQHTAENVFPSPTTRGTSGRPRTCGSAAA